MLSKASINDLLILESSLVLSLNDKKFQYIEYVKNENKYYMFHSSVNLSYFEGLNYIYIDGNLCFLPIEDSKVVELVEPLRICL